MTLAWVTGAAGFIGRHLVRHLVGTGARVAGLDMAATNPAEFAERVSGWEHGPLSAEALDSLADRTGLPETLYHLAGGSSVGASISEPHNDFSATVGGTGILLEWLRTRSPQTRLVIASSAAVYGDLHAGPIGDDAATAPFSPYGAHKFAMEAICRGWAGSFELRIVAARLFSVYGAGLTKQLMWDLANKLSSGQHIISLGGSGQELRDWTHVEDVVRALTAVAPLAGPDMPVVNVGTGRGHSVGVIAERLIRAYGQDPSRLRFSGESRPGDPFSLVAAPGRLARTGFVWRIGLSEGIDDYVDWHSTRETT